MSEVPDFDDDIDIDAILERARSAPAEMPQEMLEELMAPWIALPQSRKDELHSRCIEAGKFLARYVGPELNFEIIQSDNFDAGRVGSNRTAVLGIATLIERLGNALFENEFQTIDENKQVDGAVSVEDGLAEYMYSALAHLISVVGDETILNSIINSPECDPDHEDWVVVDANCLLHLSDWFSMDQLCFGQAVLSSWARCPDDRQAEHVMREMGMSVKCLDSQLMVLALLVAMECLDRLLAKESSSDLFHLMVRAHSFLHDAEITSVVIPNAFAQSKYFKGLDLAHMGRKANASRHSDSQELQQKYCPIIHDLVEHQGMKIKQAVFSIENQVLADAADQSVQFKPDNYERTVRGWYTKWRKKQGAAVQTSGPRK